VIDPRQQRAKMIMRCSVARRWRDVFHAPRPPCKKLGFGGGETDIPLLGLPVLDPDRWGTRDDSKRGRFGGIGGMLAFPYHTAVLQSLVRRDRVGVHAGQRIRERGNRGTE
jgi:hypothetical protein